jgi:O-antigen/teichoic acid export membrane protein
MNLELKGGAFLSYIILILNSCQGIFLTPFIYKSLGESEFGLYSLALSAISYLTILDLGIGSTITRYVSRYEQLKDYENLNKLFGNFLIFYSFIGLLTLIIGFYIYNNLQLIFEETFSPDEIEKTRFLFIILLFNLAISFPLSLFNSVLIAYEKFIFLKSAQIFKIILTALCITLFLLYGYKSIAIVIITSAFNIILFILGMIYAIKKVKVRFSFKKLDPPLIREILIYSFFIFLNIIMDRAYWQSGQVMLGMYLGSKAISFYALAIQLQQLYSGVSTAITGLLLPKITSIELNKNTSKSELSHLFIKVGRLQYASIVIILIGFIVFGREFTYFWVKDTSGKLYEIILIILIPLTIPLIQNLGLTILQVRNQMRFRSFTFLIISISAVCLQIPLIQKFGELGPAIATAISLFVGQFIVMNLYYYFKQGLNVILFWKEIFKMSLFPLIYCLIFYHLNQKIEKNDIWEFLLVILLFTVFYIPMFWKLSFNKNEQKLILSILKFKKIE